MSQTVQDKLDLANINDLASYLRKLNDSTNSLGFGALLAAMRPRNRSRTGLTSNATQEHDVAALIVNVENVQGTNLSIVTGAAPGAGEVRVEYDADTGVPTLTFNGAVTEYYTIELGPVPQTLAEVMAEEI